MSRDMKFSILVLWGLVFLTGSFSHAESGAKSGAATQAGVRAGILAGTIITPGAVYSVPVPGTLAREANFPMTLEKWGVEGGRQILKYVLPEDLVGETPIEETLTGPQPRFGTPFTELAGATAVASCAASDDRVVCLVRYKENQPFSTPRAREKTVQFLKTKYAGSPQLSEKIQVALAFGNEPAGLVTFYLNE